MRKIAFLIITILMIALLTALLPQKSYGKLPGTIYVGVDVYHVGSEEGLDWIIGNVTGKEPSIKFVKIDKAFTPEVLSNIDILILGQPNQFEYDIEELAAITEWWNSGVKAIWVASDSDYGDGPEFQRRSNTVLAAIGSKLRIDNCSIEEHKINAGRPYRVVASVFNKNPPFNEFTEGVKAVLFHGPGGVVGYVDGKVVALEEVEVPNVYWIARTSEEGGLIVENDATILSEVHPTNAKGSFVLMAIEMNAGPMGKSIVIASGESPYDAYEPMVASQYYGVKLQGPQFVYNLIIWLAKQISQAKPVVKTVTETVTQTLTKTTTETTTQTTTITHVETTTETVTKTETVTQAADYTPYIVAIIIVIIAIVAAVLITRR